MKHKYLGLMKRGLNDQHDTATLLDAFFNDFRGQYPNLAETVKINYHNLGIVGKLF